MHMHIGRICGLATALQPLPALASGLGSGWNGLFGGAIMLLALPILCLFLARTGEGGQYWWRFFLMTLASTLCGVGSISLMGDGPLLLVSFPLAILVAVVTGYFLRGSADTPRPGLAERLEGECDVCPSARNSRLSGCPACGNQFFA